MRRLVTLLSSMCLAAGLLAAQTAYACDCGAQTSDPGAATSECPHAKDGKAKCTEEGKDCPCAQGAKDCKCDKAGKDCPCAKEGKDCKCEKAGKDCPCKKGDKRTDAAKPAEPKKADAKPADAKKAEAKK
jgi:hypothetical protein